MIASYAFLISSQGEEEEWVKKNIIIIIIVIFSLLNPIQASRELITLIFSLENQCREDPRSY